MARTKQSGRNPRKMLMTIEATNINANNNNNKSNNAIAKTVQKKAPAKSSMPMVKKPMRILYTPGTVRYTRDMREMQRLRQSTELFIKRRPFERVIKEISQSLENVPVNLRFQKLACEAMQEATEAYLSGLLMDANLLTKHANRKTLKVEDLQLVQKIRAKKQKVAQNS